MDEVILGIAPEVRGAIWSHLLGNGNVRQPVEQAAFGFARTHSDTNSMIFELLEWVAIAKADFAHQSGYHIELADHVRGDVIKRAHDLGSSVVEFHSHPCSRHAEFSMSDVAGLREFVPHIFWRLKGRPYMAIVVTPFEFDAVAWVADPYRPVPVQKILVGKRKLRPSGMSLKGMRDWHVGSAI